MSIFATEYDAEAHKRVYAMEQVEDALITVARNLLRRKRTIEEIIEDTGLTREQIESLLFTE